MAPHILTIPAGNAVVNQAPIGTPVTQRPTLPFGFRELNASATTTAQTTTQIVPEVPYLSNNLEGLALVVLTRSTTPVSHWNLAFRSWEIYLKLRGILPSEDKFHSEGTLNGPHWCTPATPTLPTG
jgi:hypothetical protein